MESTNAETQELNQQKSGKNNGSLGKILRRLNLNSAAGRRTVRGKEAVEENQVHEEEIKEWTGNRRELEMKSEEKKLKRNLEKLQ